MVIHILRHVQQCTWRHGMQLPCLLRSALLGKIYYKISISLMFIQQQYGEAIALAAFVAATASTATFISDEQKRVATLIASKPFSLWFEVCSASLRSSHHHSGVSQSSSSFLALWHLFVSCNILKSIQSYCSDLHANKDKRTITATTTRTLQKKMKKKGKKKNLTT